jgi:hypothetical protein
MSLSDNIKLELENGEVWFDLGTINESLSIPQRRMLLDIFFESDEIANHFIELFKGLLRERFETEQFMEMYRKISRSLIKKFPDKKIVIYDILPKEEYFEVYYTFTLDNTKAVKVKDSEVFPLKSNTNSYNKIDSIIKEIKKLRDTQEEIECEEEGSICNQFDLIADDLESLRDKFSKEYSITNTPL